MWNCVILVIKDFKMFISRNTIHPRMNVFSVVKHSCLLNSKSNASEFHNCLLDTETKVVIINEK